MGAGFCEFINTVKAKEKIAIEQMSIEKFAEKGVKVFKDLSDVTQDSVDIIFMCNFLEHLTHLGDIFEILEKAKKVLKPGKILIMGPNMKFAYREYWDFVDHRLALTDVSLAEAINAVDLRIIKQIPRFLPFTTKSKYPKWDWVVITYLKIPFLWRFFGKQYLFICENE